jgi:chromosome segregation ATPase
VAELEAELAGLREELATRPAEHEASAVDLRALVENVEHEVMAGLREDLADRDRRLAENVNELARLNRELAESAEREAALTSLRTELADRDRQLSERALLVENVEHDAMAALRHDLGEREQSIARTSEELAERDRRLAEIAEEIARMNSAHEATTTRLREDLADRERQLSEKAEELARLHDLGEVAASVEDEHMHVLFIPTQSGYSLLERSGPAPAVGASVEVDGESENAGHFVVCKHGRPVLGGPRCAYVERV